MKVLVTYMSQSGNTKKVAEAIYEEIQAEKEIKEIKHINNLEGYDLAFVGFPVLRFGPSEDTKKFLETHSSGKNLALFVTHAAPENMPQLQDWLAKFKDAAIGANLVGMFNCQGELAKSVREMMAKSDMPELRKFAEFAHVADGQPDATRIARANLPAKSCKK